jgi:hypothetical protein
MSESQSPPNDGEAGARDAKTGRFTKGNKIGRGMSRGSKHRATLAVERLLTGEADTRAITKAILREAKAGQPWACVAWLKLVAPAPRGRLVSFDMPRIQSAADIPGALLAVASQVASGHLTPTEGAEIATVLDALRQSFEVDKIAADVEALKAQMAQLQIEPPSGMGFPSSKWAA